MEEETFLLLPVDWTSDRHKLIVHASQVRFFFLSFFLCEGAVKTWKYFLKRGKRRVVVQLHTHNKTTVESIQVCHRRMTSELLLLLKGERKGYAGKMGVMMAHRDKPKEREREKNDLNSFALAPQRPGCSCLPSLLTTRIKHVINPHPPKSPCTEDCIILESELLLLLLHVHKEETEDQNSTPRSIKKKGKKDMEMEIKYVECRTPEFDLWSVLD